MSATQTHSHPSTLPPATFSAMLQTTMDTLPHHPKATQDEIATRREAAYLIIEALRPRDPMESMLATRVVATHYHAMHNLGCATQRDLPPDLQLRFQGRAVALSRLMDATLHNLMDRQTAAPRRVAGMSAAVVAPRAQPAPEPARAAAPPAPAAAPDAAAGPAPVAPVPAAPTPAAPAPAAPAQAAPAPAAEAPAQTTAAPTAQATPAPVASAAQPAPGEKFTLDAAMAERLLADAAAQMGTSLDAILAQAA